MIFRFAFSCATVVLLFFVSFLSLRAQVPPEFSDLYPVMQTDLTNFEATVDAGWNGVQTNCH
jgi:hypothetical protein